MAKSFFSFQFTNRRCFIGLTERETEGGERGGEGKREGEGGREREREHTFYDRSWHTWQLRNFRRLKRKYLSFQFTKKCFKIDI
jgi:hypothetical protein